jgi:hypothetical protein
MYIVVPATGKGKAQVLSIRGSSSQEGYHMHAAQVLEAPTYGVELANLFLNDATLRWNIKRGHENKGAFGYACFDLRLLTELERACVALNVPPPFTSLYQHLLPTGVAAAAEQLGLECLTQATRSQLGAVCAPFCAAN